MKKIIPFFKTNFNFNEINAFKKIVKTGNFSMGQSTIKLEKMIAKKLKISENCVALVSNCTAGLHLAMIVSNIKKNDEVLCSSLTFVADASSVKYVDAKPRFIDITSIDNWNISTEDILKNITKKTKAIIMTHYAGYPCDISKIKNIAKKNNLVLIEDACHTIFSKFKNKYMGTYGDLGLFSLYGNKNITTGEGGIVIGKKKLIDKIKILRNHAIDKSMLERNSSKTPTYQIHELGYNYRIDDIRSSIGIEQLKKIDNLNFLRKKVANNYKKLISKVVPSIKIPFKKFIGGKYSYHLFPILLPYNLDRDRLIKFLNDCGVQTSIHYKPIHKLKFYEKPNFKLKNLDKISDHILSLPIHPKLSLIDQKYIIKNIKYFINKEK
ncbi:DegT/DnrJ/EryC1/StrS aminotransferase family protein [Candidatus Pelagibacter bacterium]|nr:DegT/DnrJ/EryC1/StrS aminotransferase family protein [Candidatus Pelagibacter bacterium]MDA8836276.1 DegT/DnrJ/EryC1/StrS aminotransferase family protein [Candidatus Pelagibacter bacterium]